VKTCPHCAAPNENVAGFCSGCGAKIAATTPAPVQAVAQETSGKAVASMCFGFLFLVFPAAIAAVILGHVSNSEIRKSRGRLKGGGMAMTGMMLGYAGIAAFPIVFIILVVATVPRLIKAGVQVNEVSAVGSLRMVSTAAMTYNNKYHAFPPSLEALGPPSAGQDASAKAAGLLSASLARGLGKGYVISYSPLSSHHYYGEFDAFNAEADPIGQGVTGFRHFHVDETGVIREQMSEAAGRNSPVLH
jgi:hypothetical protein